MTTDRIKGHVAFFCDTKGCEEGLETETGDFFKAREEAREADWQFRNRDGEWRHFCCRAHEEMDYRGQSLATAKGV